MTATNAAQLAELFRNIAAAFDAYNDAGGTEQTPMPPVGAPVPPSDEIMQQTAPEPVHPTEARDPRQEMPAPGATHTPVPESMKQVEPAQPAPTVEEVQQHIGMLARKLPPEKVESIKRMIQGYGVGFISKLSPEQLTEFMARVKTEFPQ